jgi:hypothetical protein
MPESVLVPAREADEGQAAQLAGRTWKVMTESDAGILDRLVRKIAMVMSGGRSL